MRVIRRWLHSRPDPAEASGCLILITCCLLSMIAVIGGGSYGYLTTHTVWGVLRWIFYSMLIATAVLAVFAGIMIRWYKQPC